MLLKLVIFIVLYFHLSKANAQLRIEQVPLSPVKSNTGFFVYGAEKLKREIPYSKINGSPFWNTEFMTATIYFSDEQLYGPCPVKLNIASNEVNFLNKNGEELTAQADNIQKIIFSSPENSAEVITVFRNDLDVINSSPKFGYLFVQELNQGELQLLKISKKKLMIGDSLFGTQKKYSFYLEEKYFIKRDIRVHALKKLSRKDILPLVPLHNNKPIDWIENNRIDLSREKDAVSFFNYLNSQSR